MPLNTDSLQENAWYCTNCTTPKVSGIFCDSCNKLRHDHDELNADHERLPLKEHLEYQKNIQGEDPSIAFEIDKENYVLFVHPETNNMRATQFLDVILDKITTPANNCPSFVSFVGPTGVGKSLLIRFLSQELALQSKKKKKLSYPVAGRVGSAESTSSDVHLYIGPKLSAMPDQSSAVQLMFFDSEGFSGTTNPHSLTSYIKDFGITIKNRQEYLTSRLNHVENSYPKMLYLFSDVLVFVAQHDWKEKTSIIKPLLKYAQVGGTGTINQPIKPKLIIIFNKVTDQLFHQFKDRATDEFFASVDYKEDFEQLRNYYDDPVVLFFPDTANGTAMRIQVAISFFFIYSYILHM